MKQIIISKRKQKLNLAVKKNLQIVIIGTEGGDLELALNIKERNIHLEIYGILMGCRDQKYNLKVTTKHVSPQSTSRVKIKGIFLDSSCLEFEGKIIIGNKAQLSDAFLQNNNLIIGENAVVNSSPQLEICANDVKASHGVTITTVDKEQMYYLKSRGLSEALSVDLLASGFVNDILKELKNQKVEIRIPALLLN